MFNDLSRLGKYLGQAARLMVGMPDYDTYVEHIPEQAPGQTGDELRSVLPGAPGSSIRQQGWAEVLLTRVSPDKKTGARLAASCFFWLAARYPIAYQGPTAGI